MFLSDREMSVWSRAVWGENPALPHERKSVKSKGFVQYADLRFFFLPPWGILYTTAFSCENNMINLLWEGCATWKNHLMNWSSGNSLTITLIGALLFQAIFLQTYWHYLLTLLCVCTEKLIYPNIFLNFLGGGGCTLLFLGFFKLDNWWWII